MRDAAHMEGESAEGGGVYLDSPSKAFIYLDRATSVLTTPPVISRWASLCWENVVAALVGGRVEEEVALEEEEEREKSRRSEAEREGGRSSCRAAGCPAFACPGIPPQP